GGPIGEKVLETSTAVAADSGSVFATNTDPGTVSAFGPSAVLPNPLYDNRLAIDAIGEAETRKTADFQTTSSGDFAALPSKLPLTGYDNDARDEVYRYDANAEELACASCPPTGARTTADASLAANGLSISEDGQVFFNSYDPLIASDLNHRKDVFEWED